MFTACNPDGKLLLWEWDVDPFTRLPIIPPKEKQELADFVHTHHLIFHNTKFDIRALKTIGIDHPPFSQIDDTLIASHVLQSDGSHGLKDLALAYLDINDDDERALQHAVNEARRIGRKLGWRIANPQDPHWPAIKSNAGTGWWKCDLWLPRAVAKHKGYPEYHPWWTICRTYALRDAERTIALWDHFHEGIKAEGLWSQYQTRLRMLEITYAMENRGVTISTKKLMATSGEFLTTAKKAEAKCKKLTKIDNLNSSKQLQEVLFRKFQLAPIKETKTGYSTDKDSIKGLLDQAAPKSPAYEFLTCLLDTRGYSKAVDYLDGYRDFGIADLDGYLRLHPAFNPTGTATTRFSSNWPNLQNVSKKEKANLRQVFGPLPGREWYSMDYSNIEMRIFAYESGDKRLIEAFDSGQSVHLIFAEILWPKEYAECIRKGEEFKDKYESTLYQWTKNGNFSLIYGAGPTKANTTYRVPDAYGLIRRKLPLIDKFMAAKDAEAKKKGYITTLGGYRLQVPEKRPHVAVNYFVQGSAGWCMILAMIRVWEYLQKLPNHHLIMTIHDELDYDFPIQKNLAVVQTCKGLMELSGKDIGVPTPVDVERHPDNWAKGERIKQWK